VVKDANWRDAIYLETIRDMLLFDIRKVSQTSKARSYHQRVDIGKFVKYRIILRAKIEARAAEFRIRKLLSNRHTINDIDSVEALIFGKQRGNR
jgi:hypothetical protein